MIRSREDMESGSGSEQVEEKSGNELESSDQLQQPNDKKKRYHRHTARQIQEMEAYVNEFLSKNKHSHALTNSFSLIQFILCYYMLLIVFCRLFKECPHPDDKQRMRLSQELGLKPRQVKFWFQNRRTQMKVRTLAHFHSIATLIILRVSPKEKKNTKNAFLCFCIKKSQALDG